MGTWVYLFTFGFKGDVFACGAKRKMIDRDTGEVIIQYEV